MKEREELIHNTRYLVRSTIHSLAHQQLAVAENFALVLGKRMPIVMRGMNTDLPIDKKVLDAWKKENQVPTIPSYSPNLDGSQFDEVVVIFGKPRNHPTGTPQEGQQSGPPVPGDGGSSSAVIRSSFGQSGGDSESAG